MKLYVKRNKAGIDDHSLFARRWDDRL